VTRWPTSRESSPARNWTLPPDDVDVTAAQVGTTVAIIGVSAAATGSAAGKARRGRRIVLSLFLPASPANVQARLTDCYEDFIRIADTIVADLDEVPSWIEAGVKRSEAEMCGKIAEKFGELLGRIAAIDPAQARAAAKGEAFRFASEKADNGEAVELPNPLGRRELN
jgi:hypothetical protein